MENTLSFDKRIFRDKLASKIPYVFSDRYRRSETLCVLNQIYIIIDTRTINEFYPDWFNNT